MDKINAFIEKNRSRFVQELLPLVTQPSLSTSGLGIQECAELLAGLMRQAGIKTHLLPTPSFPWVYGEVKNSNARCTLMLLCHYDVVPPEN